MAAQIPAKDTENDFIVTYTQIALNYTVAYFTYRVPRVFAYCHPCPFG